MPLAPKPGWAYRTGSHGGNSGAPKFQFFGCSPNRRKTNFPRGFLKNPLLESVAGDHTQLFTEGFPSCHLPREPVFLLELPILLLILCADFELGAESPFGGLRLPGSSLKGRLVSSGVHLRCGLMISWHDNEEIM